MKTTVSSKGQIVLPAEFRRMDRVEPGQEFDVERLDRGDYRLVRREATGDPAWLDRSEITLRRCLVLDPANANAHFSIGVNAIFRLQSDKGLEHARLALKYAPQHSPFPHGLCTRLVREGILHRC
jgi:bifunctional DNA-binding transcriptional regulator/antitoxin component of YhaV-PrlF toxin-antitoxin module